MCSLTNNIKFCTCKTKVLPDKEKNWVWTLKRFTGTNWIDIEIGKCLALNFKEDDIANIATILAALENDTPFDFTYNPQELDTLNIYLTEKSYEFVFKNSKWEEQNEISDHLNKKLIFQQGVIINDEPKI